jgi:hypothetical protein
LELETRDHKQKQCVPFNDPPRATAKRGFTLTSLEKSGGVSHV